MKSHEPPRKVLDCIYLCHLTDLRHGNQPCAIQLVDRSIPSRKVVWVLVLVLVVLMVLVVLLLRGWWRWCP